MGAMENPVHLFMYRSMPLPAYLDGCDGGVELEQHALLAVHLVLGIGGADERQEQAVHADRRLDHVRHIPARETTERERGEREISK